jgi:hypothetical protein
MAMSDYEHVIRWTPLSSGSRQRVNWTSLLSPVVGLFHAGKAAVTAKEDCTPQRLASLRTRADQAIENVKPEFAREAERLRRERIVILVVALVVSLALIAVACLSKTQGNDIIKAVLATGGSGGLLTWGVLLAFQRVDQESKLRLFPGLFGTEFELCSTCEAYEATFERFARAVEALRGAK